MDFATIIGLAIAVAALALSAWIGNVDARIIFARYEAFLLVFVGTLGATMVSFPMRTFLRGLRCGPRTAFVEPVYHEREVIATLVTFAEKARREGLLALENEAAELEDDFMRKGIQLVIDGRDTDIIRKILETEVLFVQERNAKAEAVFMTMGGFSPTLGIIGTVLGLIAMLKRSARSAAAATSRASSASRPRRRSSRPSSASRWRTCCGSRWPRRSKNAPASSCCCARS